MDISSRKKKILAAVIEEYIRTAEPVGSKAIAASADLGCSSATIRNELAESGASQIPNRQRLLHQHGFPKTHDFQNHIGSSSNEIWC